MKLINLKDEKPDPGEEILVLWRIKQGDWDYWDCNLIDSDNIGEIEGKHIFWAKLPKVR
ncbi:MAG: hypothetical protein KGI54_09535 [Pseudomonadota bacterium]|nr:hypothetical protein [Pseudomonadota bacterium]